MKFQDQNKNETPEEYFARYKQTMEYEKEYGTPLRLRSHTMQTFFGRLDNQVADLEEENVYLKDEIQRLEKELALVRYKEFEESQRQVGNALMSLLNVRPAQSFTPAEAITLRALRDMGTIEQVHVYLDELFASAKKELQEQV